MKTELNSSRTNAEAQRTQSSAERGINYFLRVPPRPLRLRVSFYFASLLLCVFALIPFGGHAATTNLTALLQQGLFEEQANRNLDAAIAAYASLATQFDKDRQLAATAVFRLGECYRAQGKTNEAAAQYQRILRDFSDQTVLATLSRQNLAGMGAAKNETITTAAVENSDAQLLKKLEGKPFDELEKILPTLLPDAALDDLLQKRNEAQSKRASLVVDFATNNVIVERADATLAELNRQIHEKIGGMMQGLKLRAELPVAAPVANAGQQQQKNLLARQIALAEQDLVESEKLVQLGRATAADSRSAAQKVLRLRQELAALDGGKVDLLQLSAGIKSEEDQEIERIEKMIQNSPDLINARGDSAYTPLTYAASQGWLKAATFLIEHGADVNGNWGAPINMAAKKGNRAMVELLLSRGADVNAKWDNGKTPLYTATQEKFSVVVEVLLMNKADVNAQADNGDTPLTAAMVNPQVKTIQSLLAAGANPNLENKSGRTPFSYAAENGSPEIVKIFLAAKADPNGGKVDAPLLAAVHARDVATAELLLQAGANPNAKGAIARDVSINGSTHWAAGHPSVTPLFLAVSMNQVPMVKLLLKFKADPDDSRTDGRPLLFSALSDTNILEALLAAGAKVDVQYDTWPLLHRAIAFKDAASVKIFLQHGANPNLPGWNRYTPLHSAAAHLVERKIFELLLDAKAEPNVRNQDGNTPLDLLKQIIRGDAVANGLPPTPGSFGRASWAGRPAQSQNNSDEQTKLAGELADLLQAHGALDKLPDWDRITVSRPAANFSETVFQRGTNDWNRFTLLEVIYKVSGEPKLAFPDLAHVVIVRPSADGMTVKRLSVNLQNATNGLEVASDMVLEFGDVVEIPEREHTLKESEKFARQAMGGFNPILSGNDWSVLRAHRQKQAGEVRLIMAGGKNVQLHLPGDSWPFIHTVLDQDEAKAMLTSGSDLSRVKVTRTNAKTKKADVWILDCSDPKHITDLWLRAGDVIEVPEKR